MQTNTHDFIHFYNLTPIALEIETLKVQYDEVNQAIAKGLSHPYFEQLNNFDKGVQFQFEIIERKFFTIYPHHRARRGLINGMGSIIKAISGNLDAEDAIRYDNAIETLKLNQANIIQAANRHFSITTKVVENFNNTISLLKHNQEVISGEITKVRSQLNTFIFDFNDYMQTRNILDQIYLSLQSILHLLTDLENAITFARINVLHNSIIKLNELESIVDVMLKHHTKEQVPYVNREDLLKYYNIMEVDAYYSDSTIIFILHFPLLHPEIFTHFHLFSIPSQNQTTIVPHQPYLTVSTNLYQYMEKPCKKLDSQYFCHNDQLLSFHETPDCIFQILQLAKEEAPCHQVAVSIRETIIEQLTESHYIGIFPNPTKVSTQCSTTEIQELQGTFLIDVPHMCEFQTPDEHFVNLEKKSFEEPLTLPKIKISSTMPKRMDTPIELKKIPLDDLQRAIEEQRHEQPLILQTEPLNLSHFWTTPIFIIITICLLYLCYRYRHIFKKSSQENPEVDNKVLFVPYKTSSGDGEVTRNQTA